MRAWRRAVRDRLCGLCGHRIGKGEPLQELTVPGIVLPKVRCQGCAGLAPDDLPALVDQVPVPTTMARFSTRLLPHDFKLAAAGREPGCDDE